MSLQDPNIVNPARKKRVAIVIANPAISTTPGGRFGNCCGFGSMTSIRVLAAWLFTYHARNVG
jgi:hypothetical protein